jgi:hypothetical protein
MGRPGRVTHDAGGLRGPVAGADDADLAGGHRRRRPRVAREAHPPGARPSPALRAEAHRHRGALCSSRPGALDGLRRVPAPVPAAVGRRGGRDHRPQPGRACPAAQAGAEQGPAGTARAGRADSRRAAGLDEGRGAPRRRRRLAPGRGVRPHRRPHRLRPPAPSRRPPAHQPVRPRARPRSAQDREQQPHHPAGNVRRGGAVGAPGSVPGGARTADRAHAQRPVGGLGPLRPPVADGLPPSRRPRPPLSRPAPHLRLDPAVPGRVREGGGGLAGSRLAEDHPRHLRPPDAGRRGGGARGARRRPRPVH